MTGWMPMVSDWRVSVEGRGFYDTRYTETDDFTTNTREEDLGLEADSLKAMIRVAMTPTDHIEARYERYIRSEERMTFPRGVIGNQQFGAELIRESGVSELSFRLRERSGGADPWPGPSVCERITRTI